MSAPVPASDTGSTNPGTNDCSQRSRQGANRGRFNRGGRGRDNSRRPPPTRFVGKEESLGDTYVYQLVSGREATDQYSQTTNEIIRYTSLKFINGDDVEESLTLGAKILFPPPADPLPTGAPAVIQETDMHLWKMTYQMVLQRRSILDSNLRATYSLIKGQCSKPILEKVEAQHDYSGVQRDRDPIRLLVLIKDVMFNYNSRKYRAMSIIDAIKPGVVTQGRYMSVSDYLEKFRNQLDVLSSSGGNMCLHAGMTQDELTRMQAADPPTLLELETAGRRGQRRFEGALFLAKSDPARYGRLVEDMANFYNLGTDTYPDSLTAAYELMLHDVREHANRPHGHGNPGMAFTNAGSSNSTTGNTIVTAASDAQPNPRPDVTCHKCGKVGHFSNRCLERTHANGTILTVVEAPPGGSVGGTTIATNPTSANAIAPPATSPPSVSFALIGAVEEDNEPIIGFQFMLTFAPIEIVPDGRLYSQHRHTTGNPVPLTWILLDNQSTVDVFCNKDLLTNIRQADRSCRISCNAGVVTTDLIGDLAGYPEPVWYHATGIANILSLHRVTKHCRVRYDSSEENASFHVTRPDGTIRSFIPSTSGLHYCDTGTTGTTLVNTVEENRSRYTRRAYNDAARARRLQDTIGRPSTRDYIKIVEGGMLMNCPVTREHVTNAEDIFGPNLGSLKGKTTRQKGSHVRSLVSDVPYNIIREHKNVTLCFDIMFVNKIAFVITVSRNIRFGTTERVKSRKACVISAAILNTIKFYHKRGFRVKECNADGEFEVLRGDLADHGTQLNTAAEDEHVPEIERYIRTVKERTRANYNIVPFKKIPSVMIVEMVHASNYWLNMFPAHDGVSATQSPRRILTGQVGDFNLHCGIQFGEYAQVHESHDNTMATRTTGAIALRPTGNIQGGYYFFS